MKRAIVHQSSGHRGGPITRLASPGDLGELIKPFVFLDLFELDGDNAPSLDFSWHPHSGIATVTVVLDGAARYAETTGRAGIVPAGGVEWMQAGLGVWHTGSVERVRTRGFQLWVALPPEMENAPSTSQYVMPDDVPTTGPARVILGTYAGATSPIAAPGALTYLAVTLTDGEEWTYRPAPGHDVTWVAVMDGVVTVPSRISRGEIAIFDAAEAPIQFVGRGGARFVLGSAPRHPHDLVLGYYSVHTSELALQRGQAEIDRIGRTLLAEGKQSYALGSLRSSAAG
jgi:redox-sensitive bicupin YhaK (pirin superfamily)